VQATEKGKLMIPTSEMAYAELVGNRLLVVVLGGRARISNRRSKALLYSLRSLTWSSGVGFVNYFYFTAISDQNIIIY